MLCLTLGQEHDDQGKTIRIQPSSGVLVALTCLAAFALRADPLPVAQAPARDPAAPVERAAWRPPPERPAPSATGGSIDPSIAGAIDAAGDPLPLDPQAAPAPLVALASGREAPAVRLQPGLPSRVAATAVPLPASTWLFGTLLVGLLGVRRRRLAR